MWGKIIFKINACVYLLCLLFYEFYQHNVALDIERSLQISFENQNSASWQKERKVNLTASRWYELCSYSKIKSPNWPKKIKYFSEPFTGNLATNYGLEKEAEAVNAFRQKINLCVFKTRLLVHPQAPWLGYSPDGLLLMDGELKTLEVKCPVQGIGAKAEEIAKTLIYLYASEDGPCKLKQKLKYYGQVQYGRFITGAKKSHFLIYSNFDQSYVLIVIERNEKLIRELFVTLQNMYFKYCLLHLM